LSVGSLFALQGVLLAMMLQEWGWPATVAVPVVILGSMAIGAFHGVLITLARMQPFVVTLCGLLFYRGLAQFISKEAAKGFGSEGYETLRYLANGNFAGVPMPLILLVVIGILAFVVLHCSVYGRYLLAVGRNEDAAKYSGINTKMVIGSAYVISMGLAGVAGILIAFYTNSISPATHGSFYELYGIAAAVLGGCSLVGGEGSIIGIIIGTALLQVLQNLVNLLGIPSSLNFAVMGAVILIGVLADRLLAAQRDKRRAVVVEAVANGQDGSKQGGAG
jgi:ribose transport system permease protein